MLAHRHRESGLVAPTDEPEEHPPRPAIVREEYEFTDEELQFESPDEIPEPPLPPPAPISHASPPPRVEVRPRLADERPPDEADPRFYIADAHTNDLTRWIQDPTQSLEVRRKVRDELAQREPFAEGGELDAIRWVLATHGRRL